jgi:hypothetical protein
MKVHRIICADDRSVVYFAKLGGGKFCLEMHRALGADASKVEVNFTELSANAARELADAIRQETT